MIFLRKATSNLYYRVTKRYDLTSNISSRSFHKILRQQQCRLLVLGQESRLYCGPWNPRNKELLFTGLASLPSELAYSGLGRANFSIFSCRNMATPPDKSPNAIPKPSNSTGGGSSCSSSSTSGSKAKPKFSATKEELKARLSPIQYQVTQLKSTERPGSGEYNKFNKKGTYHCVVCDEELFKSDTKFESGCGWPAFFDTTDKNRLKFVQDYALVGASNLLLLAKKADLVRTEVLCANCDAHLGHRFDDGPISKGGKRYCINSAALRFVPSSSNLDDH